MQEVIQNRMNQNGEMKPKKIEQNLDNLKQEDSQEMNKMGVMPVKKLMLSMGVPMIFSMVLQALYNIIDSYFVSKIPDVADEAMNALTLAFPIQMLMVAIGVGTGVGINAILSRSLGEGNKKKASQIAGNAIFLGICTYCVFLLFGVFGIPLYLRSQTENQMVIGLGKQYLSICTILSFGVMLNMIYEKLLQATGKTMQSTIAQMAGAITNIILDPVMIFGLAGFPELGIRGAAYATVIGQIVTMVLGAYFHYKHNIELEHKLYYLKPKKKVIKGIYMVGFPAILMQALMSFMTYGVNIILGSVSGSFVTAYGVYYKIQQFVFFAAFGLNNALIPILAFNYGREDKKRMKESIRYGMIDTLIIMAIGMIGLEFCANLISGIFALSPEIQALCTTAIHIIAVGYLFAGANIAYQGIFQALGYGIHSLVISLIRLVVVALPLAWLFVRYADNKELVFWAFPIAEFAALIVAVIMSSKIKREKNI